MTCVGVMRMSAPWSGASTPAGTTAAVPRIVTQRGRHGGSTSSTTMLARPLLEELGRDYRALDGGPRVTA